MKPFLITIPHSGEKIPPEADWLQGLPEKILMSDVDRFVDRLYRDAIETLQIRHVKTPWHRYVVDLNRLPDDVDADSVAGHNNPAGTFTSGLLWVKTMDGFQLMKKPITSDLYRQLVKDYFSPFHEQVKQIYGEWRRLGAKDIYHLDAHSMPSMGTAGHRDPGERRAEIVISDFNGKSCKPWFKDLVTQAYTQAGFQIAYNWPYIGGRVTQTYGHPEKGQNAIQVELRRDLYMDEVTKQWDAARAEELIPRLTKAIHWIWDRIPVGEGQ